MKPGIHPEYMDCTVRCSCGNTFTTRSTKSELKIDICNACHPFYTGTQKLIDTGGRVQRFADRFGGSATELVAKREAERKAAEAAKKAEAEAKRKAEREAKAAAKAERAAEHAKKAAEAEAAKPTEEDAVEQAPEVQLTEPEVEAAVEDAVAADPNLDAVSEEAAVDAEPREGKDSIEH